MGEKRKAVYTAVAGLLIVLSIATATAVTFDNDGGGLWPEYMSFPITTVPGGYAQYKLVINGQTWELYNAEGALEASGTNSDFWSKVQSDGDDIRVFDDAGNQLYFYIESFDSANQQATILVRVEAGDTELNIAYGNPSATASSYNDPNQVFGFYWHYSSNDLSAFDVVMGSWTFSSDGLHSTDGSSDWAVMKTIQTFNPNVVLEVKHKSAGSGGDYAIGFGEQFDASNKIGIFSKVRQGANKDHSAYVDGTFYNTVSYPFNTDWHITKVVWTADKIEAWIDDSYYTYVSVSRTNYPVLLQSNNHEHMWEWIRVYKLADPADFGTPSVKTFYDLSVTLNSASLSPNTASPDLNVDVTIEIPPDYTSSDDLTKAEIYVDGSKICEKSLTGDSWTGVITCPYPTSNLLPSNVQVKAYSLYADSESSTIQVSDPNPPTFSFSYTYTASGIQIDYSASDDLWLRQLRVYYNSVLKKTVSLSGTSADGSVVVGYPSSLPATIEVRVYDLQSYSSDSKVATDTQNPTVTSLSFNTTDTNLTISFTASDNTLITKYEVYLDSDLIASEDSLNVQTLDKTVVVSSSLLVGKTTLKVTVYDLANNVGSKSVALVEGAVSFSLVFLEEDTGQFLNLSTSKDFRDFYIYIPEEGKSIWIIQNGTFQNPPELQGNTLTFSILNTTFFRVMWRYSNDWYYVELEPWVIYYQDPTYVAIPTLVKQNVSGQMYYYEPQLYELLVLSSKESPVIVENKRLGAIKLASSTKYSYDRYLSVSAFLQRDIYDVYTYSNGVFTFLSAVDGGKAQSVNLDALAAIQPVSILESESLDVSWVDNQTLSLHYKTLDTAVKATTIKVYVNGNLITTIEENANEVSGVIYFPAFNTTIEDNTTIKIEVYRAGELKIVREFIGHNEVHFTLPRELAIFTSVFLLMFGMFMLGTESTLRYFGIFVCLSAIAFTTLTEQDFGTRVVQVVSLILIIAGVVYSFRRRGS